ncbi:MAG: hypothetical protein JO288_05205 [Hyphomicrobiales bacterium]|nr:hypothetical protein [Hyphomicrobiales bacterium]
MKLHKLRLSALISAAGLVTLVAATPAAARYENSYGVRHHVAHSRIHPHHYGYRYGPARVVAGAGAAAGAAAGGLFDAGVNAWDALDCATFGYYCRR